MRTYFAFGLHPQQHLEFLSLLLAYLMPLFVLAIRWKSSFGDSSQIGVALASFIFHLLHALFLAGCIWMIFDPPFSPRHAGIWAAVLLSHRLERRLLQRLFPADFWKKNRAPARTSTRAVGNGWIASSSRACGCWCIVAVAGLAYRNAPQIRDTNGDTLRRYASLVEEKLPASGGYLLSDDPQQLALVQSALVRDGRARDFVPLETQLLVVPAYHRFLHRKFPATLAGARLGHPDQHAQPGWADRT